MRSRPGAQHQSAECSIASCVVRARTPDVAVVISLKLVYTPVDDNVTSPHKSQVTSHKQYSADKVGRDGILFQMRS